MGLSDLIFWLLLGFVLSWNFSVNLLILVLSLGYLLVFALFTVASRPLVTSWADAPAVALKMQLNIASTVFTYMCRGFRPLYPNWSLAYEVTVFAMRFMFVDYGKVIAYENTAMMRAPFAMAGKMMLKSNCREHHTTPETVEANGLKHLWLRDEESKTAKQRLVVIHFHGGGYAISDPLQDVELVNLTHSMVKDQLREKHGLNVAVDVLLANYRKAPEHPYPTPLDDCQVMYEYVLKSEGVRPKQVVFSGDSVGAEMSITICMRLRDAGRVADQPLVCLMYSPDVDMNERGVDTSTPHCILTDNFADSVLDIYLSSIKDPEQRRLASPINNDLTNLPPLFIQLGTLERFYQQGLRFMEKVKKQGVTNVELDVLEGMPHDVVMFPTFLIPFAKEAISHGCVFAAKHAAAMFAGEPEQEP